MPNVNCAVIGCSNSTRKIKKWEDSSCEMHVGLKNKDCLCERPYRLYCFPSILRNNDQRERWIKAMRREEENHTVWKPKASDRVCSEHFVDGIPTPSNPDPTLNIGYEQTFKKPRRELFREPLIKRKKIHEEDSSIQPSHGTVMTGASSSTSFTSDDMISSPPTTWAAMTDHSYNSTPSTVKCGGCNDKTSLINSLVRRVNELTKKVKRLQRAKAKVFYQSSSYFTWTKITSDAKMNFYTGISSVKEFNTIFLLLQQYLPQMKYWRGPKRAKCSSKVKKRSFIVSKTKKLSHRDEFLLTLMRLRLGLLNEDLADRFGISVAVCSNTFSTWIKLLSTVLGKALVVWLPREAIRDNLPEMFVKTGHSKCRVILDCSEVFMERPKSLANQAYTWSDYKHHNTLKFLVGITPSGFISFLSDCYGGRASDKFITADSGFYDLLERDDEVMADRGFQIKEELLLKFCNLTVPPGARIKSQMTVEECKKTKDIANLRVHVERAINRMKFFRILKNTLPVTMLHHIDNIILTCAALCNIKPLLIAPKNK